MRLALGIEGAVSMDDEAIAELFVDLPVEVGGRIGPRSELVALAGEVRDEVSGVDLSSVLLEQWLRG
jgi:hypothetical protein